MHKTRHFPLDLPRSVSSVRKIIAENSPLPGATHESSNEWLQNLSYNLYTRSVFFYKGPLLSVIPEISELVTPPSLLNAKIYKKDVRKALVKYQVKYQVMLKNGSRAKKIAKKSYPSQYQLVKITNFYFFPFFFFLFFLLFIVCHILKHDCAKVY